MPLFSKQKKKTDSKDKQNTEEKNQDQLQEKERPVLVSASLTKNIAETKKEVGSSSDVIIREIKIGEQDRIHLAIIYIAGLVDNNTIHEWLIEPLVQNESIQNSHAIQQILEKTLPLGGVKAEKSWDKLFSELMLGNALVFADGYDEALICSTQGESSVPLKSRAPRCPFVARAKDLQSLLKPIFL